VYLHAYRVGVRFRTVTWGHTCLNAVWLHATHRLWLIGRADYHERMLSDIAPAFRIATQADVPAVVALVESAYRGESGRRGWTTESDLLDGRRTDEELVSELLVLPGSVVLLALTGDAMRACCHVQQHEESAYFGMFAVDPLWQGSGLGKQLLAEAERMARETWRCRAMHMTVIDLRGELIAWYERRGYRRTGQYKPFPYGNERFGIPRRDDLRFELLIKEFSGART
jgi:GNAT superfamily N-acetyltransferase